MSTILRIVLAIVIGVLVTGLLDYFGVLTHALNVLLGFVAALLFYFGYPDAPRRI